MSGDERLHELSSCDRNSSLSNINLDESLLPKDFLRFGPTHCSRIDGYRDLKKNRVLGDLLKEGTEIADTYGRHV